MISLNDVLLAASNIPVDDPIAEIWGRGLQGGYKIIEYTGSLPITINANGDVLLDYRIYGASGGVGVATENLWDVSKISNNEPYLKIDGDTLYLQCFSSAGVPDGKLSKLRDYVGDLTPGKYILIANSTGTSKYIYLSGANAFLRFGTPKQFDTQQELDSYLDSVVFFYASGVNTSAQIYDIMFVKDSRIPTSYVPYGYKLPIVSRTENLFDVQKVNNPPKCTYSGNSFSFDGKSLNYDILCQTNGASAAPIPEKMIAVSPGMYTIIIGNGTIAPDNSRLNVRFFDGETVTSLSTIRIRPQSYTIAVENNGYLSFVIGSGAVTISDFMFVKGSTAPTSYTPYSHTDIPVYIGENQLGAGEYVSYSDGKIYRTVSGTLTPTDPPLQFPEIPTVDGTTIIDYDGDPKPSQMYVKYKGKSGGA